MGVVQNTMTNARSIVLVIVEPGFVLEVMGTLHKLVTNLNTAKHL